MKDHGLSDIDLESWRRAFRERQTANRDDCPTEDSLVRLVLGEVHSAEREQLAEHLIRCRPCGREWRILREVDAEARGQLEAKQPRRQHVMWIAAGLAAIGLGAFLLLQPGLNPRLPQQPETTELIRGTPEAGLVEAVEPRDGATLAKSPLTLSWPGDARGSTKVRVTVFTSELKPIWSSEPLAAPRVELPAEVREHLEKGRSFLWSVESMDSSNRVLGPFAFRIAAGGE